jgi:hypothetical protein
MTTGATASSPYPKWDADCRGRNRTADPFDVRPAAPSFLNDSLVPPLALSP